MTFGSLPERILGDRREVPVDAKRPKGSRRFSLYCSQDADARSDIVNPPSLPATRLGKQPGDPRSGKNVTRAHAAVAAVKADWLPNVAVVGGYANNNLLDVVQPNIGFVGVFGSYTFIDWGKRRNTIRERDQLAGMARWNSSKPGTTFGRRPCWPTGNMKRPSKRSSSLVNWPRSARRPQRGSQRPDGGGSGCREGRPGSSIAYVKLMAIIGKL
jgi:hypothetical protein